LRKYIPILAAAGGLAVIAVAVLLYSSAPRAPAEEPREAVAGDQPSPVAVGADEMVMGTPEAPVTIIEYASLTCGHCGRFHNQVLPTLKSEYIDPGLARLVYRDFPLDGLALQASMLAHCAGKERYFGFLEILFRDQARWTTAEQPQAALAQTARIGGLGEKDFESCLANKDVANKVLQARLEGEKTYQIQSTPTFIINGKKYAGAMPYEEFDQILRRLLPDS
jgi:protein-disulfide isomerase